ncbi:MAG: WXG100 family type VII secretion target [Lachnospiraceae bacterium]|nr:WXG100 family type VII secretion target [Lachnospiraceae bacterium]
MAEKIAVNTTRLGNDAESVGTYIANIKKQISEMKQSVKELDAMWEGPSSEAFKKAFEQDMKAMDVIIEGLLDIKKYEDTAKKKYENCENKVATLISEIKV